MITNVSWLSATEQLTWRRLLALHMELFPAIDRDLKDRTGMGLDDYSVLVMLSESSDGRLRMSELADRLSMQPSRLTYRVGQLEHMGFVERVRSNDDGRSVYATLTAVGSDQLASVAPVHVDGVRRLLVDHFEGDEFGRLGELVGRVTDDSARVAPIGPNQSPVPQKTV